MRLLFKQRLFSWFDSCDSLDEKGSTVYVIKRELSWGQMPSMPLPRLSPPPRCWRCV